MVRQINTEIYIDKKEKEILSSVNEEILIDGLMRNSFLYGRDIITQKLEKIIFQKFIKNEVA